jgi:hypothetical protein
MKLEVTLPPVGKQHIPQTDFTAPDGDPDRSPVHNIS